MDREGQDEAKNICSTLPSPWQLDPLILVCLSKTRDLVQMSSTGLASESSRTSQLSSEGDDTSNWLSGIESPLSLAVSISTAFSSSCSAILDDSARLCRASMLSKSGSTLNDETPGALPLRSDFTRFTDGQFRAICPVSSQT
ncbi:unnamed protein product [Somion occarium]|uniref:Uncharacterized protein n=1 Tax=Somion occarium TaxID=3059160 RepID=A0ABP1D8N5_9APHY